MNDARGVAARGARARSLAGIISAMGVVTLVYAITFPLFALVLDQQGVSHTLIGLSTMTQAGAVLFVAPLAPRLMQRFAPARLMQGVTLSSAALLVVAGLFQDVWLWFPLRFVLGALNSMLWIASEALINELAEERSRGRVVGVYAAVGSAGLALGPLTLVVTGSEGLLPFGAAAALILVAALPLAWVPGIRMDAVQDGVPTGVWAMFLLAPTIMLANVVYAAAAESIITFFPLFGMHLGTSENFALSLLTVLGVGSMLLILPLSWLADRVDRMALLAACIVLTMAGLLIMPHVLDDRIVAVAFFFLLGGAEGMIYALGVMLVGQRFRGAQLAAASTTFTASWAVGTVIGPLLVGAGMDRFGVGSLPLILFAFFAVYLPLPLRAWLVGRLRSGSTR